MNHMHMQHDESGHLPEGIQESIRAEFPVGSIVEILTDHMADMTHAKAKVAGVFDTIVYSVSYTDTNTGEHVKDHKWIVDEETKHAGEVNVGDQVEILANHMSGMKGAIGTVERVSYEPVYMVDYQSTEDGHWVKNHQWVIESELKPWEE